MQEKPHVMYILNLLKNTLPPPLEGPPVRLPTYSSLILLHALRSIFYPSTFVYPLTARFLLQRPALDTADVPMLYGMLYSSSDDWRKERAWIIRFLADGMVSSEDWKVLRRRHTWDLLSSFFQCSEKDHGLRNGILEVRQNIHSLHIDSECSHLAGALKPHVQLPGYDVFDPQIWTVDLDRDAASGSYWK
jgi:nucleolar pre-ribosomal-associated protein 1